MYEQIERNVWTSRLLLGLFVLLIVGLGYVLGRLYDRGYLGLVAAAVIATAGAWASYYYSDRIVLAISQAREVTPEEHPFLHNTGEGLAIAAGLPKPRLYLIQDSAPNAFATGRDPEHAVIVVTSGLLEKLSRLELEGVIAHEMAHIQHFDIRLSTLVVVLVGIVAPIAAQLIRFAISRQREYLADAGGAMLTRYPEGLATALEKLDADREPLEVANKATAHLYIVNPLKEWGGTLNGLFNTHPPIEERVRRLRGLVTGGVA